MEPTFLQNFLRDSNTEMLEWICREFYDSVLQILQHLWLIKN